jgi:hypothetical protein
MRPGREGTMTDDLMTNDSFQAKVEVEHPKHQYTNLLIPELSDFTVKAEGQRAFTSFSTGLHAPYTPKSLRLFGGPVSEAIIRPHRPGEAHLMIKTVQANCPSAFSRVVSQKIARFG